MCTDCEFSYFLQLNHLTLECVYARWGPALTLLLINIDHYCFVVTLITRYVTKHHVIDHFPKPSSEYRECWVWPYRFWTCSCSWAGQNPIIDPCCKLQSITFKPQFIAITTLIQFGVGPRTTSTLTPLLLIYLLSNWIWEQLSMKSTTEVTHTMSNKPPCLSAWSSVSWGLTPVRKCVLIILL